MFKILENTFDYVADFFSPSGTYGTYGESMPTAKEVLARKREEMIEAQKSIEIKPQNKQTD